MVRRKGTIYQFSLGVSIMLDCFTLRHKFLIAGNEPYFVFFISGFNRGQDIRGDRSVSCSKFVNEGNT